MTYRDAAVWVLLTASLLLISCSGNSAPQPGTPAFYWNAAKETYAAADYQKTVENLGSIVSTDNEFTARAQPLLLILTSGMAQGYMDLADAYEAGGRANHAQATNFHKQLATYREAANTMALQFADTYSKYQNKDDMVTLAFAFPTGSATDVVLLNKIAGGAWPNDADLAAAQKHGIEHEVVLATCSATGAARDPAKVNDLLKGGDAKVTRAAFIQAMANALYDESQLYAHNKLDQPDKLKIFCSRALDALKQVPASKDSADLDKKIQTALKKVKA